MPIPTFEIGSFRAQLSRLVGIQKMLSKLHHLPIGNCQSREAVGLLPGQHVFEEAHTRAWCKGPTAWELSTLCKTHEHVSALGRVIVLTLSPRSEGQEHDARLAR